MTTGSTDSDENYMDAEDNRYYKHDFPLRSNGTTTKPENGFVKCSQAFSLK